MYIRILMEFVSYRLHSKKFWLNFQVLMKTMTSMRKCSSSVLLMWVFKCFLFSINISRELKKSRATIRWYSILHHFNSLKINDKKKLNRSIDSEYRYIIILTYLVTCFTITHFCFCMVKIVRSTSLFFLSRYFFLAVEIDDKGYIGV